MVADKEGGQIISFLSLFYSCYSYCYIVLPLQLHLFSGPYLEIFHLGVSIVPVNLHRGN